MIDFSKKNDILESIWHYVSEHSNYLFLALCLPIHVAFCAFFHWIGIDVMSVINLISSLVYVVLVFVIRHATEKVMAVCFLEITAFATVSTALLGMDAGFFLYIIGMMVLCSSFFNTHTALQIFCQAVGSVALFGMMELTERTTVYTALSRGIIVPYVRGLYLINIAITVGSIIFMSLAYASRVRYSRKEIVYVSEHDELTGLYNRSYLREYIDEIAKNGPQFDICSVMMMDIDNFKRINDTYGHDTGDDALRFLGRTLLSNTRRTDIVCRWGGEEFLILLENCPFERAADKADELRLALNRDPYATVAGEELHMTVTIGVTCMYGTEDHINEIISFADLLLYEGKNSGKNKVVARKSGDL